MPAELPGYDPGVEFFVDTAENPIRRFYEWEGKVWRYYHGTYRGIAWVREELWGDPLKFWSHEAGEHDVMIPHGAEVREFFMDPAGNEYEPLRAADGFPMRRQVIEPNYRGYQTLYKRTKVAS